MTIRDYLTKQPGLHHDFFLYNKRDYYPLLFPTICAFLNTEGGLIIIGISRDKQAKGMSETELDTFKNSFNEKSKRHKGFLNPSRIFHLNEINEDNTYFLVIRIERSPILHKSGDRFYKRVDSETVLVDDPQEISKLFSQKRTDYESTKLPEITQSDLDLELLKKARAVASTKDSTHKWLSMSDDEIIRGSNLAVFDNESRKWCYCISAVLILGRDETIARYLPGYKFDIYVRIKDTDRWDNHLPIITNLMDTRNEALDFIKRQLDWPFYEEGGQRRDLGDIIFREVVGNVIIHRDYSNALATEIEIQKENVIATNPNIIYHKGELDPDNFENYPKNPNIRRFFNNLGWSDEAGSGVRNVKKYLNIYSKGAMPRFYEDNPFRTTLPLKGYILDNRYTILLDMFGIKIDELGGDRVELMKYIRINPKLDDTVDTNGFIVEYLKSLEQISGKLPDIKILRVNALADMRSKYQGTLDQKAGELILKKGKNFLKLLIGLLIEMSLDESMNLLELTNLENVRVEYIQVLKRNGLIELTIPDNPTDQNQKYITAEKGRRLLGGIDIK